MKIEFAAVIFATALGTNATLAQMPAPDNTQSNARPVNSAMGTSTADSQKNTASDLQITQRIRQSVIADKSLSTYAHNVKIVSVNGMVTLNGVVKSELEKTAVESKARAVVAKEKITNDLTVAPSS